MATAPDTQPPGSAPLRGTLRHKSRMEMLQDSYLRAIASASGCTMAKPDPDDGIDWVLTHASEAHTVDSEVDLKIQLKSTSSTLPNPANGKVSVPVSNGRFLKLAQKPVTVNRILVAMVIPRDVALWIAASHDVFELRHCCYWINMAGMAPNPRSTRTTVDVSTSQIFDDVSLCEIMRRIGRGEAP